LGFIEVHREDIKAAVRKRGTTLKALALTGGLSESACRKALDVPSPRAEALIAECINQPIHKIWPDRYDCRGGRRFTKVNNTSLQAKTHRQFAGAS
jgi:Ner family transcriptional regulator